MDTTIVSTNTPEGRTWGRGKVDEVSVVDQKSCTFSPEKGGILRRRPHNVTGGLTRKTQWKRRVGCDRRTVTGSETSLVVPVRSPSLISSYLSIYN